MSDDQASELYDRYFTVVPADRPELIDAAHVLRYQVYCIEHPFENPADHPTGREIDRLDANSVHAVLLQRQSGQVVGCVRLILPRTEDGVSALPMRALLDEQSAARLDECDPGRIAEISRYAVSKTLRRREGEELYPDVTPENPDEALRAVDMRRVAPHLSVGLMRGVATLAAQHGVTTVCAAMAPALVRLLKRFGLQFEPLGPPIDYHGLRHPCIATCDSLLAGMAQQQSDYFHVVEAAYQSNL